MRQLVSVMLVSPFSSAVVIATISRRGTGRRRGLLELLVGRLELALVLPLHGSHFLRGLLDLLIGRREPLLVGLVCRLKLADRRICLTQLLAIGAIALLELEVAALKLRVGLLEARSVGTQLGGSRGVRR